MMKKHLTTLVLVLLATVSASAQLLMKKTYDGRQPADYYMKGAVTEQGGKIVFSKDIDVPGRSAKDLFFAVGQWAELRYAPNTVRGEWFEPTFFHNFDFSTITKADVDDGVIVCQGDEELVFTNKILNRDATRFNYVLSITITDGHVRAQVSQLVYTYTFVEQAERMAAEDWISDREAFNKKGHMLKAVARFRVKTVDFKDELFKEIEEAATAAK